MKSLLGLLATVLIVQQHSYVKLNVTIRGKQAGRAISEQLIRVNGTKENSLEMRLTADGKSVLQTRTSLFDSKGNEISALFSDVRENVMAQAVVKFDSKGAHVTKIYRGQRQMSATVPPLKGIPTINPSEWWFARDKPKPGSGVTYQSFDPYSMKWQRTTRTYSGRATITLAGKKVQANVLTVQTTGPPVKAYVDDKGLPLLFDSPMLRLERVF